jgi:GNAT superfamily N-acetyltransferase
MGTITVRQATPEDATALAGLLDLFDGMGATPDQVTARMLACQNVLTTFISEIDGQPVGFACLRLVPHLQGDEPYAELTDIYVDAPLRRHGMARALIAQVEAAARAHACEGFRLAPKETFTGLYFLMSVSYNGTVGDVPMH